MALPNGPYNHKEHEENILNWWLSNGYYKPEYDPASDKVMTTEEMKEKIKTENRKPKTKNISESTSPQPSPQGEGDSLTWALICPPPNAYARPHIGNISGYAYMDAMARYQRMNGKKVLVLPGKDHAGLEGEGVFVREVLEKQNRNKFDMKREDFYKEMMEFFMKNIDIARNDEKSIGLSADFDKDTFTLDPSIVEIVLDTFVEMYKEGRIYKGVRIVNWDPKARTAVADNQVEYKESQTPFFYFKYAFANVDESKRRIWKLNFYKSEIWNALKNGTKAIETRALNPEEPERYFGEMKDGDVIMCVNKSTGQELMMLAKSVRLYENAEEFLNGEDFAKIKSDGGTYSDASELIADYNTLAEGYGEKLNKNGVVAIEMEEFYGDPEPKAIDLKNKYQTKGVLWKVKENKKETSYIEGEMHNGTKILGIGYDDVPTGSEVNGEVIGIQMRLDNEFRLVVKSIDFEGDLNQVIQKATEDMFKTAAGAHIILFDEYPEDKFYTNGIILGTVRPETKFGDTAIAVNPKDERYKSIVGKKIKVRTLNGITELNIVADYAVEAEFGTGAVKVTPAHSAVDWEIAGRHPAECLPPKQVIGYDLKLNHLTGKYEGMNIKQAREAMREDLKKEGLLIYIDENYQNRIQIAERTKAPIEPLLSSQWYLKYDGLKEAAMEMVELSQSERNPKSENRNPKSTDKQIRKAEVNDARRMFEIDIEGWMQNFIDEKRGVTAELLRTKYGKDINSAEKLNEFESFLKDENEAFYVAEENGGVIGWANIENLKKDGIHWVNVYIDKDHQRKGVGTSLLKKIISEFGDLEIHIATPESAKLTDFYTNLGFVEYPVEGRKEGEGNLFMIQMKRKPQPSTSNLQPVHIHPENMVAKFNHWMTNLRDWAISRSLWWGYRLPVWYSGEVKEEIGEDGLVRELICLSPSPSPEGEGGRRPGEAWVPLEYDNPAHIRVQKHNPDSVVIDVMRHAESIANLEKTFAGSEYDCELTEQGIKDAENIALENKYDLIITSTLKRAKETGRLIKKSNNLNVEIIENELLNERSFGNVSSRNREEVAKEHNLTVPEIYQLIDDEPEKFGSETLGSMDQRVSKFIDQLKRDHKAKRILIITHGGIVRSIEKIVHNLSTKEAMKIDKKNLELKTYNLEAETSQWIQDENVLDTWFSSGQWVYATLEKYNLMDTFFPTQVLVSAHDILENWDSRMMMFTYFKHKSIPFENLYLTGLVLGKDGQKMSKSKGNVLDIDRVRTEYGTDATRLSFFYQNSAGGNYSITDDKLKNFKQFNNKIWNASRFVLMNVTPPVPSQEGENLPPLREGGVGDLKPTLDFSRKVVEHIKSVKENVTKNIDLYEFGRATDTLYHEFWHTFCDVLIEESKPFVLPKWNKETKEIESEPDPVQKAEVTGVMLYAMKEYIKMLHPFIPFITQAIWNEIPKSETDHKVLMYSKW